MHLKRLAMCGPYCVYQQTSIEVGITRTHSPHHVDTREDPYQIVLGAVLPKRYVSEELRLKALEFVKDGKCYTWAGRPI